MEPETSIVTPNDPVTPKIVNHVEVFKSRQSHFYDELMRQTRITAKGHQEAELGLLILTLRELSSRPPSVIVPLRVVLERSKKKQWQQ